MTVENIKNTLSQFFLLAFKIWILTIYVGINHENVQIILVRIHTFFFFFNLRF